MKVEIKKSEICVIPKSGNKIEVIINRAGGGGGGLKKLFFDEGQFEGTGTEDEPITLLSEFIYEIINYLKPAVLPSNITSDLIANYFYSTGSHDVRITLHKNITKPKLFYQKGDGGFNLSPVVGLTIVGDTVSSKGNAILLIPISGTEYHLIHLDLFKEYVEPPLKIDETSGNKTWDDTNSDTYYSDISAAAYTITLDSGITKPIMLFQKGVGEGTFVAGSGVTLVGDDLKTTQNDAVMVYPFSNTEYHIIHLDKSKGGGGVSSFIVEEISGTKTITASDSGKYFYTTAAADFVITLEDGITEPIAIFQKGNGRAEIVGDTGVTIVGGNWTADQNMAISVVPESSTTYHIIGGSDE